MATVNRPNAPQDYCTPPELLAAVQARFGRITFDAACTLDNAVAINGYHYPAYDALERDWRDELEGCVVWCNPPFGKSGEFARVATESQREPNMTGHAPPRVLLLVPASVGTSWFAIYVHGKALVLALSPRVKFVGQAQGINRDLMLCVYGPDITPGFEPWRWKK
jgi:hypothetical protein